MAKVTIAIPNAGEVRKEVLDAVVRLIGSPCGHELELNTELRRPVDNCRNVIVRDFLAGDGEYLLFIDSDNPPVDHANPLDLIGADLDVVVFPTPIYAANSVGRFGFTWNVYSDEGRPGWAEIESPRVRGATIEEIDAGGTGCMLIARRVLESVRPAFLREWDEDGCMAAGSDLLFCRRVRAAGFKVHVSWEHPCHHWKTIDLLEARHMALMRDVSWINRADTNSPGYWDSQWNERQEMILPFYAAIADRVGGKRVLDYGCGRGDLLALLGPQATGYDISPEAVTLCHERKLRATIDPSVLLDRWDAIVCCEVLEHVEDPEDMLARFFHSTDLVIYSVPNNCMPPGMEPEHRRVFTRGYCQRITPHLRSISESGYWLVVVAERTP